MRGRVFRGTPEAMAAYQPYVAPKSLQKKGVPAGFMSYLGNLMFFHPHTLPSKTTAIAIEGEQESGKSTFAKSMTYRLATLQASDANKQPEKWRTRITSRRSEQGVAEYGPVAKKLHADFYKLGKGNRINLLGLLRNPTDVINAATNIVQEIGKRWDDIKIAPAISIAVYRLFDSSPDLVGELLLAETLRGLTLDDFVKYRKSDRERLMKDFEAEFEANPNLRSQLNLDHEILYVDESFVEAAQHAANCLEVLMGSEYDDVFGGKNSLFEVLIRRVVLLDTEELSEKTNTVLESVIMAAEASAVQYDGASIGTKNDMTRIIPHLNISDEEGVAAKSLYHMRTMANSMATTRKKATSLWRLYQFGNQIVNAGSAGSEIRSLAAEIDQGVGARFFFRQSDDSAVLHRISQFPGMSQHLVEQLPFLERGEAVLWVRNQPPVLFHHRLLQREIPLIQSNYSRERMSETTPVYKMDAYKERRAKLEAIRNRVALTQ